MHPQRMRDKQEMTQLHLLPGLHPLDRRPVEAGRVGQRLLGHVEVQPPNSYAVADRPAGVEDPWRVFGGWHPTNRLRIMIAGQQQICCIH